MVLLSKYCLLQLPLESLQFLMRQVQQNSRERIFLKKSLPHAINIWQQLTLLVSTLARHDDIRQECGECILKVLWRWWRRWTFSQGLLNCLNVTERWYRPRTREGVRKPCQDSRKWSGRMRWTEIWDGNENVERKLVKKSRTNSKIGWIFIY